jgi:ribonuclease HII
MRMARENSGDGAEQGQASVPTLKCEGTLERDLRSRGYSFIAGTDEVGRGSLFGAVVAAAAILSPDRPIRGLNDSKLLDPERREELAVRIKERAVAWSVAAVDAAMIDRINIYQASRVAMKMAVELLIPAPDFVLIDAVPLDIPQPQQPIIHGDARCHAIAAASIVAKVYRDEMMRRWDTIFPEYGLARNKGYLAPEHIRALREFGPTPLHRMSYDPVRANCRFPIDPGPGQMDLFRVAGAM